MKRNVFLCSLIFILCSMFLASCINPFYPFQKIIPNEPTEPGDPDCYNYGECEICDLVTDCNDCGVCEICDPVDPDFTFNVSNEAQWLEARAAIAAGGNGKNYTINITGNFSLPGDTDINDWDTFGTVTGITILIRGTYTITLNDRGWFMVINSGQTLVMRDLNLKGFSSNGDSVVYVDSRDSKAEFIMEGIASVSGNNLWGVGGGVNVFGSLASFTMRDNAKVYDNSAEYGGGVYVRTGATFIMRDNARVYNNSATYGGGVHFDTGATFIMQDNARVHNNSATYGGGVHIGYPHIDASGASFIMQGNSSVDFNSAAATSSGAGGGVYVVSGETFTRSGNASVTNNSSAGTGQNIGPYEIGDTGPGGGIVFYADYAGFTVQGTGSGNSGSWPDSYRAHYLEAAPNNWGPGQPDPLHEWALETSPVFINVEGTSIEIGTGRKNTALIIAATGGNPGDVPAANRCNIYEGSNATNDWFLPSKNELNELCLSKVIATVDGINYFTWSSSQVQNEPGRIWLTHFHLNYLDTRSTNKTGTFRVRPIRAF